MNPYESIRITAGGLADGASERSVCPWCDGGASQEASFIVTRDGQQAKYVCFRASCTYPSSGVLSITGSPSKMRPVKHKPKSRALTADTEPLSLDNLMFIYNTYGLNKKQCDEYRIVQDKQGKLVIPTYDQHGLPHGHEVKKGAAQEPGPKTISYPGAKADGMSWYMGKPDIAPPLNADTIQLHKFYDTSCVLVEDAISAMKANVYMNSIALLGTNLNQEQALSIAGQNFDRVYIALDADASAKAFRLVKRLRGILHMRVMLLEKDIKNMTYDEIAILLSIHHRRI